jgi:hypothetical protein
MPREPTRSSRMEPRISPGALAIGIAAARGSRPRARTARAEDRAPRPQGCTAPIQPVVNFRTDSSAGRRDRGFFVWLAP